MKELVPTAKLSREPTPDTVNYEIPTAVSENVPSVLKQLEENSEKLGLVDIQIGLTRFVLCLCCVCVCVCVC